MVQSLQGSITKIHSAFLTMTEQSTSFSYAKLEKIQHQLHELHSQKEQMMHHLEKNIIDFLKKKNAFSYPFEMLIGALDDIMESLQTQNPSPEHSQIHQKWQKNGSKILKNNTRNNTNNTKKASENKKKIQEKDLTNEHSCVTRNLF